MADLRLNSSTPEGTIINENQISSVELYRRYLRVDNFTAPLNSPETSSFGDTPRSVSVDGNWVVVGDRSGVLSTGGVEGAVHVYETRNLAPGTPKYTIWPPYEIHQNLTGADSSEFGVSVDVSGDYVVIGAPNTWNADLNRRSGKVAIYQISTNSIIHIIDSPDVRTEYNDTAGAHDQFGQAVAIDGDWIAIGAPHARADNNTSHLAGRVYVYRLSNTISPTYTLLRPDWAAVTGNTDFAPISTYSNGLFGVDVDIDNGRLIVGHQWQRYQNRTNAGCAAIYDLASTDPNAAGEPYKICVSVSHNPGGQTSSSDSYGNSVAISGSYAIVGSIFEDGAGGTSTGYAQIIDVNTGKIIHTISNVGDRWYFGENRLGESVDIDGGYAIVGAPGRSPGYVAIFDVATGLLIKRIDAPQIFGSGDSTYGQSVAISGNNIITSAPSEYNSATGRNGVVYHHQIESPNVYVGRTFNAEYAAALRAIGNSHDSIEYYSNYLHSWKLS